MRISIPLIVVLVYLFSCFAGTDKQRDELYQPERIMDSLAIKPGMVIGEVGAGEGYFTFWLAKRLGTEGKVYANDIDENALNKLQEQADQENIKNIQTVIGEKTDPLFPQKDLDMIVMMLVFHDLEQPVAFFNNLEKYLKPDAPVVIIDRDPDRRNRGWHHFMKKEEILDLLDQANYKVIRLWTFLAYENIFICRPVNQSDNP